MTNPADSHPPPDTPNAHYIDAGAFDAILQRWLSLPLINRARLTNTITADYFYPLARNIVPAKGKGHIEADDLIQECTLACVRKMRFYNPSRATAFNFFTTVCINTIKTCYSKESLAVRSVNHQTVQINDETTATAHQHEHELPTHEIKSPLQILSILKGLHA